MNKALPQIRVVHWSWLRLSSSETLNEFSIGLPPHRGKHADLLKDQEVTWCIKTLGTTLTSIHEFPSNRFAYCNDRSSYLFHPGNHVLLKIWKEKEQTNSWIRSFWVLQQIHFSVKLVRVELCSTHMSKVCTTDLSIPTRLSDSHVTPIKDLKYLFLSEAWATQASHIYPFSLMTVWVGNRLACLLKPPMSDQEYQPWEKQHTSLNEDGPLSTLMPNLGPFSVFPLAMDLLGVNKYLGITSFEILPGNHTGRT
jgi:hypothetical protein